MNSWKEKESIFRNFYFVRRKFLFNISVYVSV